jgi:trimethylamine:corrinoid methyltransferase-like protein
VEVQTESLATALFAQAGPDGQFLKLKETRRLFKQEQYLPSKVIDRVSNRAWQAGGSLDTFARARARVDELLARYVRPALSAEAERDMRALVEREARRAGMDHLPGYEGH